MIEDLCDLPHNKKIKTFCWLRQKPVTSKESYLNKTLPIAT
jgi:hypothetical protein